MALRQASPTSAAVLVEFASVNKHPNAARAGCFPVLQTFDGGRRPRPGWGAATPRGRVRRHGSNPAARRCMVTASRTNAAGMPAQNPGPWNCTLSRDGNPHARARRPRELAAGKTLANRSAARFQRCSGRRGPQQCSRNARAARAAPSRAQPSRARGRVGQPQQQGSPNGLERRGRF